jgi:hypothetical protein
VSAFVAVLESVALSVCRELSVVTLSTETEFQSSVEFAKLNIWISPQQFKLITLLRLMMMSLKTYAWFRMPPILSRAIHVMKKSVESLLTLNLQTDFSLVVGSVRNGKEVLNDICLCAVIFAVCIVNVNSELHSWCSLFLLCHFRTLY